MQKDTKRALRRHHLRRIKKRRMKDASYVYWISKLDDEKVRAWRIGKLARAPKICSCAMCGNPRKFFNSETRKETLSRLMLTEGIEEYYESV